jgi:hypothetical protein
MTFNQLPAQNTKMLTRNQVHLFLPVARNSIQFNSILSSWMPQCKHIQNFQESFEILCQNFEESKSVIILPSVYDQPYAALAPSTEFSMLYVEKDIKMNTTKKYLFACSSLTTPILSTSLQVLLNIMMPPHQIPLS